MLAQRMLRLGTETAFDVLVRARALEAQGRSIVHLEIGEPDFDTPQNIVLAAVAALRSGFTHYNPAAGIPELRQAIAGHIGRTRGIDIGPDWVVVTPGAKPIMFFALLACVDEGDEVLYPNPGFPIYESVIRFIGAKPVPVPLRMERGFGLDPDELAGLITNRSRFLIVNSPHNPTGGVVSPDDIARIARLAVAHDLTVLSDEIYSDILYAGRHRSLAAEPGMAERTIILDGFSKTYAMTGWRAGYGVCRPELAAQLAKLQTNSNSCTATFTQMACVEALNGPQTEVHRMVAEFQARRDAIVAGLNRIPGFRCLTPDGAFYAFPDITGTGRSSEFLADYLLNEAGVACLSGTAFGAHGQGFLRFSYATSIAVIEEALARIDAAVRKL